MPAAWVLITLAVLGASGCSSEDVTGEPEEIQDLVEVVAAESECIHDEGADQVSARVTIRNDGADERTVRLTPVLRSESGDASEATLSGADVAVAGGEEAETTMIVDGAPDDLAECAVAIDGGDPVELTIARE